MAISSKKRSQKLSNLGDFLCLLFFELQVTHSLISCDRLRAPISHYSVWSVIFTHKLTPLKRDQLIMNARVILVDNILSTSFHLAIVSDYVVTYK